MKEVVKGLYTYKDKKVKDSVPRFWHDCKAPSRLEGSIKGRVELVLADSIYKCSFCNYTFGGGE